MVLGRDVGGPGESVRIVRLADLDPAEVDMRTILLIGSSQTRTVRRGDGEEIVWTPRRYPENRTPVRRPRPARRAETPRRPPLRWWPPRAPRPARPAAVRRRPGCPASRAAVSLGAVAAPPLSLVTSTSTRWARSSVPLPVEGEGPPVEQDLHPGAGTAARARPPTAPGTRASSCGEGGEAHASGGEEDPLGPAPAAAPAASSRESAGCQSSPSAGRTQPGRRRASRGTWAAAAAAPR